MDEYIIFAHIYIPGGASFVVHLGPGSCECSSINLSGRPHSVFRGEMSSSLMTKSIDGGQSSSVSVSIPIDEIDFFSLRRKNLLQNARADFYFQPQYKELDSRRVVFSGVCQPPEYQLGLISGGETKLTFKTSLHLVDKTFPPYKVGDDGRFSGFTIPDGSLSLPLPIVIGEVLNVPLIELGEGTVGNVYRYIIAGHKVLSNSCRIIDQDGNEIAANQNILATADRLGGFYSYVDIIGQTGSQLFAEEIVGYPKAGGGPVAGLGDVLIFLWNSFSSADRSDIDFEEISLSTNKLNAFQVSCVINAVSTNQTLFGLLSSRFQGQFPVVFQNGSGRVSWSHSIIPNANSKPVRTLEIDLDFWGFSGPIETSSENIATSLFVEYGFDSLADGSKRSILLDKNSSQTLAGAASRWGNRGVNRISISDTQDRGTAYKVAENVIATSSRVREALNIIDASPNTYKLNLMDVVRVKIPHIDIDEDFFVVSTSIKRNGLVDLSLLSMRTV